MNRIPSRATLTAPLAVLALAGLLAGCQKTTTTSTPDGATTSSTTTSVAPATPSAETTAAVKSTGNDIAAGAGRAANKAGDAIEDSAITAKVKTALLADPAVKGLQIEVDTKDGVVTLKGAAPKSEGDRAVQIARDTSGVKSVDNQIGPKS
jgi:hyperosmotically inducible protein